MTAYRVIVVPVQRAARLPIEVINQAELVMDVSPDEPTRIVKAQRRIGRLAATMLAAAVVNALHPEQGIVEENT